MRRYRLAVALVIAALPVLAGAQPRTDLLVAPLVSIQPAGYGDALPYLDNGVSGTEPGLALGIVHRTRRGLLLELEASTTAKMSVSQSGRLVFSDAGAPCERFGGVCGPVTTRHADTLLSFLAGGRVSWGSAGVELLAGPSLVFGTTEQGTHEVGEGGQVALTAGLNGAIPLNGRFRLAPWFRYSYVFRGDNAFYVGLGSHVFRIGLGLRVRLGD